MGGPGQPVRQQPLPTTIPLKDNPNGILLWQSTNGDLYVLNEDNIDSALTAEYGANYGKEIAAVATKEILNTIISMVKVAPQSGVAANLVGVGFKVVLKGTSSTLADKVRGKELTVSDIAANYGKELLKPTTIGLSQKLAGGGIAGSALNTIKSVKNFILSKDLKEIVEFKRTLKFGTATYKLEGNFGFLSYGRQAEKLTIKYIKTLLANKAEKFIEYDISQYASNWDEIDIGNFERFIGQGFSVDEAIYYVQKRVKGLTYSVVQFTKALQQTKGVFQSAYEAHSYVSNIKWNEWQKKEPRGSIVQDIMMGDLKNIGKRLVHTAEFFDLLAGEVVATLPFAGGLIENGIREAIGGAGNILKISFDLFGAGAGATRYNANAVKNYSVDENSFKQNEYLTRDNTSYVQPINRNINVVYQSTVTGPGARVQNNGKIEPSTKVSRQKTSAPLLPTNYNPNTNTNAMFIKKI